MNRESLESLSCESSITECYVTTVPPADHLGHEFSSAVLMPICINKDVPQYQCIKLLEHNVLG